MSENLYHEFGVSMFGQTELPPEPKGYEVTMQIAPQLTEPENLPTARPIRDASESVQAVCEAIMEGRLHIVNTIQTQPQLAVDSRIVIDPK